MLDLHILIHDLECYGTRRRLSEAAALNCRNFISGFAHRLNQLSLAKIAVAVSREFSSPDEAVNFLQEVCSVTQVPPLDALLRS